MKPQKAKVFLDIECYSNYFLVMMMRLEDNKITYSENWKDIILDNDKLEAIFASSEIITFNGNKYDIPLLKYAMTGATCSQLKDASDYLINNGRLWDFEKQYKQYPVNINYIDLIEVLPGKASLKLYGGRIHAPKLQDLPIDPAAKITEVDRKELKKYCSNDLELTKLLYLKVESQINLRRAMSNQYNTDLRSKSDAQIAEEVLKTKMIEKIGMIPAKPKLQYTTFRYEVPSFISFQTDKMKSALEILNTRSFVATEKGEIQMPKELIDCVITIGKTKYQMGMGGLHSQEKSVNYIANKINKLADWDVASYYPNIILNCGFYPKSLGKVFLDVYKEVLQERLIAKSSGDKVKDQSLKITLNGSFGKLGSCYSVLYAPDLMVQVTVTGQLSLLMLIEAMELNNIPVISANTDGIVINYRIDQEEKMCQLVTEWEQKTQFNMERSEYTGLYSRDINNYIAIKEDGSVKVKGCFKPGDLQKNPQNEICNIAIVEYLTKGIEIEETITACKDITKFLSVRTVKGGAVQNNKYIGKNIRWYYVKGVKNAIFYKSNGNKVPKTDGARPLMDLPEVFPDNINYEWYINEAYDLLSDIGLKLKGQMSLW